MTCVSRCVATVWAIAVVAVLALLLPCRAGNASGWSVGGYFKSFFTALDAPTILADDQTLGMPVEAVVSNRLRLHLSLEASDAVRFSLAYGVLPQVLSRDGSLGARGLADQATLSYRAKDFRRYLYPRDGEARPR